MNKYRITVSFGDGNPKNTTIKAKNGWAAQQEAIKLYPSARNVHVLGLVSSRKPDQKQNNRSHLIFGCDLIDTPENKRTLITCTGPYSEIRAREDKAKKMLGDGHSRVEIAKALGVSHTTVRRYLKSNK
jgi:DNA-binding NarL/FixJ family response regulator